MIVRESALASLEANVLFDSLFKDMAKKIVDEAAPQMGQIISSERARIADALLGGLPFVAGGAALAVLVAKLVPPILPLKIGGYLVSIGLGGFGIWKSLSSLARPPEAPVATPTPTEIKKYTDEAIAILVERAKPLALAMLDAERSRLVQVALASLPWMAGGGALAAVTALLLPGIAALKAAGYVLSIGLGAIGAGIALERWSAPA